MSDPAKESDQEDGADSQGEMTFVEHLVELRNRLLRVVLVVAVLLLCMMPFANQLYALLAAPLLAQMQMGSSMIATQVASPFLTPFKLALVAAVLIAMPYILYQFWAFVAPGLYRREKRLVFPLMVSSSFLFYLGMAFAYFVVFPLMFAFFQAVAPEGVEIMTDISSYLDFVLKIFFAFGLAFEVPIATVVLVWTGFTTPESLKQKRPYIIVGAFVVGMLLTPPGHDFPDAARVAGLGAVRAGAGVRASLRASRSGRGYQRRERELIRPGSSGRDNSRISRDLTSDAG